MTQVTVNGNTYSDDGSTAKDMLEGGYLEHLFPMISDTMVEVDNAAASALAAEAAASGALYGFRNKLINPLFSVNQLGKSGTVTLAAGEYGHDGWKAGASGCTYTFSASEGVTTLTISAGSLKQVVIGADLLSGTYKLTWTGTAQGKIGAGSYSSTGVTGAVTGGSNLTIEFNTGTLSKPQLEFGSVASLFEHRFLAQEEILCFSRMEVISFGAAEWLASGLCDTTTTAIGTFSFFPKRTSSLSFTFGGAASDWCVRKAGSNVVCTAISATASSRYRGRIAAQVASGLAANAGAMIGALNAQTFIISANI
jgi:hypothetical protein